MKKRRKTARSKARRLHPWIRLSIWSLHRHDHLIAGLRMVMWSSAALVLLAVFAGRLDLETALRLIAFGGLSAVVLLTGLVLTRRNVLLGIDDPVLKSEVHQAMLALIRSRTASHPAGRVMNTRKARNGRDRCVQTGECGP